MKNKGLGLILLCCLMGCADSDTVIAPPPPPVETSPGEASPKAPEDSAKNDETPPAVEEEDGPVLPPLPEPKEEPRPTEARFQCDQPNAELGTACADGSILVRGQGIDRFAVSPPLACLDDTPECRPLKDSLRLSFQGAADFCEALQLAGTTGWRLPTIEELGLIYCASSPLEPYMGYPQLDPGCQLTEGLQGVLSGFQALSYWSESESLSYAVYKINFRNGYVFNFFKLGKNHFRCVRSLD